MTALRLIRTPCNLKLFLIGINYFNCINAGQKLSIEFAKLGCHVVGCDISEKGLNETKNKLKELGFLSKWTSCVTDVTDRQKVYDTAKKVSNPAATM